MPITIELTVEAFDHIAAHVPGASPSLHGAFRAVNVIKDEDSPKFIIDCNENDIEILLDLAKQYWPAAVRQIQDQILEAARQETK